jgi:hypothetical protein
MQSARKSSTRRKSKLFRSLIATAFIANGFFPFVAPVLAQTKAGQVISNTATATYEDPNQPGTTINATSNTVTVTVAEVAGITVTNTGVPTDSTPADAIKVNDILTYTFTIKNVGNDPTKFRIPNLATTTGPGVVSGNLKYSTNGGTSYTDITSSEVITGSIPVGGTILVQVPVTVQAVANTGDIITVQLGDTPGNAQNVPRVNNGGDVYTVDNADGGATDEIAGAPINGTREASAKQQSVIGSLTNNLALATLLKTRNYDNKGSLDSIIGDEITYDLSLRVESNDVTGLGITPNPLAGYTGISVDGDATKNYILVSDVIPAGTVLAAAPTSVPTGWTAVYSTAAAASVKPNEVAWTKFSTTSPSPIGGVTRVGFVKETVNAADYIPVGTTVSGFSIKLAVPTGAVSPLTISNIAQVVGQTPGINGLPVYDESGDQNPSNYNGVLGNMKPGVTSADGILPTNAAAVTGGISDGIANPTTQGVDASNNNTGVGDGGEANVFVITAILTNSASVLNGPLNAPGATGPDGTTATDFTNKSSFIPAGTSPGSKIDPQALAFSNTVQNNGTTTGDVTLVPSVPANKLDLPTGTTVTITYNGLSAVYTYDQAGNAGNGSFTTTATTPVTILAVGVGASVGYGVEVNLPAGTKLSTDTLTDYTGDTEWGYPVPITATLNGATNVTIDRVYTGFLQLVKFSRILQGTSDQAVVPGQDNFESTPTYVYNDGVNPVVNIDPNSAVADLRRTPLPGNIIEYQIRYKNISDLQAGVGNVTLKAGNIVITEDGTLGTNNWAKDNDGDSIIDTSNVTNPQASDSNSGTIQFFPSVNQSGTTQATDVTKYVNTVNQIINPQGSGRFTFQRKVN